jgi:hypothetical protein
MTARRRLVDQHRRNNVIQFPARGPFVVWVRPNEDGWLVVCRSHGWAHSNRDEAVRDAQYIAHTHGVAVEVKA